MNQRITRRRGKCVLLCDLSCDLDWQLAIETSETAPSRAPPQAELPRVSSARAFAKQTMAVCRRIFPPLPVSVPYFDASASPLESFFDSLQLSVSEYQYACFAVSLCSDLRSYLRSGPICAVRFFSVPCPPECYLQSENENRA